MTYVEPVEQSQTNLRTLTDNDITHYYTLLTLNQSNSKEVHLSKKLIYGIFKNFKYDSNFAKFAQKCVADIPSMIMPFVENAFAFDNLDVLYDLVHADPYTAERVIRIVVSKDKALAEDLLNDAEDYHRTSLAYMYRYLQAA